MKATIKSLLLISSAAALASSPAANAYEAGDILIKGGAATVAPNEDSGTVTITGGEVKVNDNTQLGLTFTYMYTDKIGIELLAATPFEHDIAGTKALAGVDIASIKHLPPTLTLNYYFADSNSKIQPYIGAGVNYTIFFDEDADSDLEGALGGSTDVELDDSWGLAFHAGVDYQLNDKWALNAGYWYLDIDTNATLKGPAATLKVDVDIDPHVYMIGLSYKF